MSRNPYLAASRPSSSYTRSSRTSKRSDLSTGSRGTSLGRSRSFATLGGAGGFSSTSTSAYNPSSTYVPYTSSWQRSTSSSRLGRSAADVSSNKASTNDDINYTSSSNYKRTDSSSKPSEKETPPSPTHRSTSSRTSFADDTDGRDKNSGNNNDNDNDSSVLFVSV